jgi:hypothetical protein
MGHGQLVPLTHTEGEVLPSDQHPVLRLSYPAESRALAVALTWTNTVQFGQLRCCSLMFRRGDCIASRIYLIPLSTNRPSLITMCNVTDWLRTIAEFVVTERYQSFRGGWGPTHQRGNGVFVAWPRAHGRVPRAAKMRYPMGAPGRGCRGVCPRGKPHDQRRAIGSAGERLVHTEEVTGSIPVSPTQKTAVHRPCFRDRAVDPLAWCPILGAVWERILPGSGGCPASNVSRTGTIERGTSRARSRSEAAQRSCNAMVSSTRMASLTWLYTPRMPGTSCPIRSDLRTSAMRSSSIHVWWPCRSPCGVRPGSTGSHDARARSAAGNCPDPSQRSAPALCSMTLRSSRRGTARPQTAHRPVAASLTSRATPRPAGGWKASPGTASGHGGTGRPGKAAAASTRTGTADRLPWTGYDPSAAGRKNRLP